MVFTNPEEIISILKYLDPGLLTESEDVVGEDSQELDDVPVDDNVLDLHQSVENATSNT